MRRRDLLGMALVAGVGVGCQSLRLPSSALATATPLAESLAVSLHLDYLATAGTLPGLERARLRSVADAVAIQDLVMGYVDAALLWGQRPALAEGLEAIALAADALAFVVHPANQVGPVGCDTLAALFSGATHEWSALGQSVGTVSPVLPNDANGVRTVLDVIVMGDRPVTSAAVIAADDSAVLDYVTAGCGAVGCVPASKLREGVRAMTVDERRPEPQRVREGDYPLMVGVWGVYRVGTAGEELVQRFTGDESQAALAQWLGPAEFALP